MKNPIISGDDADKLAMQSFHLTDIRALTAKILRVTMQQAQRKLDAAGSQAEEIELHAREEGYEDGHKDGLAKGEAAGREAGEAAGLAAFQERVAPILPLLTNVLIELDAQKTRLQANAEAALLGLSLEIAARIVRREIDLDPQMIVRVVKEAIGLVTRRNDLILLLHAEDVAAVEENLPEIHTLFSDLGKVSLRVDESIERGGAILRSDETEIDLQISTQLQVLGRLLLGDDSAAVGGGADKGEGTEPLQVYLPPAPQEPDVPPAAPTPDATDAPAEPSADLPIEVPPGSQTPTPSTLPPPVGEVVAIPEGSRSESTELPPADISSGEVDTNSQGEPNNNPDDNPPPASPAPPPAEQP